MNEEKITIPLKSPFRFVPEPLCFETEEDRRKSHQRMILRSKQMNRLRDRILHSDSGAFLVAGYRGVGKTSFVNAVLHEVAKAEDKSTRVIGIRLTLAREIPERWLMHQLIRRLYLDVGAQLKPHLGPDLLRRLKLAYRRTVFNMAFSVSSGTTDKWTRHEKVGITVGIRDLVELGGEVGASKETEKSYEEGLEISLLDYDDRAAEDDIVTLSSLLTDLSPDRVGANRWRDLWRRLRHQSEPTEPRRVKVIFVFDEMDKIRRDRPEPEGDPPEPKGDPIKRIFRSLKNILTTTKFHFIFVVDETLANTWRDDSLYRSVFADVTYLPCTWNAADQLCEIFVDEAAIDKKHQLRYDELKRYLAFRGRGIIRDVIREFEAMVQWHEGEPCLMLDDFVCAGIDVYSPPQQLLDDHPAMLEGIPRKLEQPTDEDELRQSVHRVIDTIIRDLHDGFDESSLRNAWEVDREEPVVETIIKNVLRIMEEDNLLVRRGAAGYVLERNWRRAVDKRMGLERRREEETPMQLHRLSNLIEDARLARQAYENPRTEEMGIADQLQDYAAMVEAYDRVLEDPYYGDEFLSPEDLCEFHLEFAKALNQQEDAEDKAEQFESALKYVPDRVEAVSEYAVFLLWQSRTSEAERYLQRLSHLVLQEHLIQGLFDEARTLWDVGEIDGARVLVRYVAMMANACGLDDAPRYGLIYNALQLASDSDTQGTEEILTKSTMLPPAEAELLHGALNYSTLTPIERRDLDTRFEQTSFGDTTQFLFDIVRRTR